MPKKKAKELSDGAEIVETPKEEPRKVSAEEYEKRLLELASQGLTAEKIGQKLREEGIHPKQQKKRVSQVLKENNQYTQPDTQNVKAKLAKLRVHAEKNRQDKRALREVARVQSQYRKLTLHYKIPA